NAAVLRRNVVNELLDDDRLSDASTAEEADLAAAQVRLEEVDDLDTGLDHVELGRLVLERRRLAVNRPPLFALNRAVRKIHRLAEDVEHAAERRRTDRHRDALAGIDNLHAALHAVGRLHGDGPHPVLTEVLLDLADHVQILALDEQSAVDLGQPPVRELDVDDGTDDLHDASDFLIFC